MSSAISSSSTWERAVKFVHTSPCLSWFVQKGYKQGVFWALMICVFSVSNDVLMRFLGGRLHVIEISFFRFLFTMLSVLPFMVLRGSGKYFQTQQPGMHTARALVGAVAIALCCYSVNIMPLSENTTIMFTEPLFFLPLAFFLLKENVDKPRWIATALGFFGLVIIVQPGFGTFQIQAFVPMTAALLFACLNIMAKKMIKDEHPYTLLFYFGLGTTLCALPFVFFVWEGPTIFEIFLLFCLGCGGNMIQVCLFRAFSSTDASSLMPFRYVEFVLASSLGFLFFGEIPTLWLLCGALLIAASTFYISHVEVKREKITG